MTRYEYFEAWLTPKEWATWKKHTYLTSSSRKAYLSQEIDFDNMLECEIQDDFVEMIDGQLSWSNTPQGLDYWQRVAERGRPIRTL